jgi:uncharacterized protein YbaP (TraB family)
VLLFSVACGWSLAAKADPAFWRARGPHATVYLLGTVHVLPRNVVWENRQITDALRQSQQLWLEIADPAAVLPALWGLAGQGFDPLHPLPGLLSKDEMDLLLTRLAVQNNAMGRLTVMFMRPWLAGMIAELLPMTRSGVYDPHSGVDVTLRAQAIAAGKEVRGFETADMQFHAFSDLPEPVQVAFLKRVLASAASGKDDLRPLIAAWQRGDVAQLAALTTQSELNVAPEINESLLTQRNARFARGIAELLRGNGTFFVAVGAAHLAGENSVQRQAALRGVYFQRINALPASTGAAK